MRGWLHRWLRSPDLMVVPKRFPVSVVVATLTTASVIAYITTNETALETWIIGLGLAWLATVVFALLGEANDWPERIRMLVAAVAAVGVAGLVVSLNADHIGLVFVGWALFVGLIVARFPKRSNDVWEFNFRMWTGSTFSGFVVTVLYAGVALFLVALDEFFALGEGVNLDNWYGYAAALLYLFVFPWLTLSRVPTANAVLNQERRPWVSYLTRILVAVAVIYLGLIYAVTLVSLVTWSLPEGQIGWLVGGFAGFGVAVWMIAHPLQNEFRLVGWYHRRLHLLLIVPLGLLAMAIYRRVADYGITESRYMLAIALVWLTLVTVLALAGKSDLRTPPAVLVALLLIVSFGPQSVEPVSIRSQISQLEELLIEAGALEAGTLTAWKLDQDDSERARSILAYVRSAPAFEDWLIATGVSPTGDGDTLATQLGAHDQQFRGFFLEVAPPSFYETDGAAAVAWLDLASQESTVIDIDGQLVSLRLADSSLVIQTPDGQTQHDLLDLSAQEEAWSTMSSDQRTSLLTFEDEKVRVVLHLVWFDAGTVSRIEGVAIIATEPSS